MDLPKLRITDDGIVREEHSSPIITSEVALYAAAERARMLGDEKKPLLVVFDRIFGFTEETHDMDTDVILKNVTAIAFCVHGDKNITVQQKILIEDWFAKTPWPVPTRVFFDEKEATAWLTSH